MPNIDIEDNVEQERWYYTIKYNKWEGEEFTKDYKPKQNRMLENNFCNDRFRKDEVVNILPSFNRKNILENSCNDEEEKSSEEENKGDKEKLNKVNDVATMNISQSNEEPSVLTGSRREEMMQKLSQQEKKRSIDYLEKIYIVSSLECCL
jgi:hypothetical protein